MLKHCTVEIWHQLRVELVSFLIVSRAHILTLVQVGWKNTCIGLVEVLASVPTLCSQSLIHANLVKQNWQLFCWNCLSNYLSCLSVKSLAFPGLKILRENFLSMAEVCCLKLATLYSNSLRCKFPSCQITPAIMPPPPNSKELLAFYAHPLDKKIPQFSFRLVLDNVTLETSGDYRCQVMFGICNVRARYFQYFSCCYRIMFGICNVRGWYFHFFLLLSNNVLDQPHCNIWIERNSGTLSKMER